MKHYFIPMLAIILLGAGCVRGGNKSPVQNTDQGNQVATSTNATSSTESSHEIPQGVSSVKIFMVALSDNGKSGELVGCGDSVVPVTVSVPTTTAPLTAALNELFKNKTQYYGSSGLYNALYQSDIKLESAVVANGKATIYLRGTPKLGGVCDEPRFASQIIETAKQFSTVSTVEVYINGNEMFNVLGGKG